MAARKKSAKRTARSKKEGRGAARKKRKAATRKKPKRSASKTAQKKRAPVRKRVSRKHVVRHAYAQERGHFEGELEDVGREHYARVKFGYLDDLPEIYAFFYAYLPKILREMGETHVGLKIERLEPLDERHTNLPFSHQQKAIMAMTKFAISHGLHKDDHVLIARVPVSKLPGIFKDYNVLFDLFFTDIQVSTNRLQLEMMDGFFNALLVKGRLSALTAFRNQLQQRVKEPVQFSFSDPLEH